MQANTQTRVLFLENWLRTAAATSNTPPPPPVAAVSARSILQAWAELRDPSLPSSDSNRLVAALQTLDAARSSLHIADPQAKLLLSFLSSDPPLTPNSLPFILRLLYFWLRKTPRASPSLVNSAAAEISKLFSSRPQCPAMTVLLLGALIATPALKVSYRRDCLDLLCRILVSVQLEEEVVAEVFAGIGYALSRSDEPYFSKIFSFLLTIWNRGSPPASVYYGLMILSLLEWLVTSFINLRSLVKVEIVCGELSAANWEAKGYAPFAVSMASAGFLRAFRLVPATSMVRLSPDMRSSVEGSISSVARRVVSSLDDSLESSHLLQCISVGLARVGLVSFSAPILLALCIALLKEIFPLGNFCRMAVEIQEGSSVDLVLEKVKGHLDSVVFKEAGAITSVFCNQYASADEGHKGIVENYMWEYSLEFYSSLRAVALVHRGKHDELLGYLEKVAEAAFLMIVVHAAEVASQKLNPKSSHGIQPEASVRILIAFSCIEYMRRVRLPEYTNAVQRAVLTMQENAALCVSFVESIPSYSELTNKQGLFALEGTRYVWSEDEVQTARILFFLRVIPTCISRIPASVFGKLIAPTMFLYLQHPNEKVAKASHSVFVALMSSGNDSDKDERLDLKEKLVFYYTQRSLEAYPGITPFEGLASGVAALVRHLPAGSPAIFYCINCLTGKTIDLCKEASSEDTDMWRTWEGSSEICKKVLDLLMRLIYLVDIQVLPYLLKQLAEFILQLPEDGQKVMLDELYAQVAESDDVTRKPVLVSWLQSLSYLCLQKDASRNHPKNLISPSNTAVSMNGTSGQILQSYLKCGKLDTALDLFSRMEERNVRSWNAIITGLVQGGRAREALGLFQEMQFSGGESVKPDKITIASVIKACASIGALDQGKWVHGYLRRQRLDFDVVIGTALIDMYGKCGSLAKAREVFEEILEKDVLAWTAMISALAVHGCGEDAFVLFEKMVSLGLKPNHVTFGSLLNACAHSGLVEKGRWCFDLMRKVYLIEPQVQHFACMVDLLGRAGLFSEAETLIRSMPMEPDFFVWGALLGACRMHGNVELGEVIAGYLMERDPLNHAFYIVLCDIYAKVKRYEDVKRIWNFMKEMGIKKTSPGCSMIDVDGQVREFSLKGTEEELLKELNWVLNGISAALKSTRWAPVEIEVIFE